MANKIKSLQTSQKLLLLGAVAIVLLLGFLFIRNTSAQNTDGRVVIADAVSKTEIDKTFSYPITDDKGAQVSSFSFTLDNAEMRDEIVVEGKKATSVAGRTFLVINLEIKNEYNRAIEIDTQDYFRLVKNGNEDQKLAPDIHNDPVEVQAISTKLTRIAFPINDTDSSFKLYVGEINGNKETVEINLQYK